MEIIQQELEKMTTQIESLKEENRINADTLDEKDEEIKKLTDANHILDTKLSQKTNEVDLQDRRLSHEQNGLRGKLANREKQIEELKEQIDQTKLNAIEFKDNQIAKLKVKVSELESQQGKAQAKAQASLQAIFTEFMEAVNKSGYVKHRVMNGRYGNGKAKYKTYYIEEGMAKHLKEYPQSVTGENRLNTTS